jgi:DnaJ-class molecular chaperone
LGFIPDYYRILEVRPDASPEVIEKAYKALALKYHPDKHPAERSKWATKKMLLIKEAYQVLSDPIKRRQYDEVRRRLYWEVFLDEGLLGLARYYLSIRS